MNRYKIVSTLIVLTILLSTLVLLNQLNIIKKASATTPGFDEYGYATTDLVYGTSYSSVHINSSTWALTNGTKCYLYYPTYLNTGAGPNANAFSWNGPFKVGISAYVDTKSKSALLNPTGTSITFNRSGIWIFDSDTNHSTYEGYIWVNTSTVYTIQSISDFNYHASGNLTVTVNTGTDTGCIIDIVRPDNTTLYHKWRSTGVSDAIKINAANFSMAGDYTVKAYRDFDLQDDMYLYADEGEAAYSSNYGRSISATGYTYATIGPWDSPEKNATEITFTTTKVNNPPVFGAPSPTNGSTGNLLSFTWSIPINDLEGNIFSWTIQCSNGQTNSSSGASNGTKTLSLSGFVYSTTYKVWVNATDPAGSGLYTRKWYTFTTMTNLVNNPPVFGTPSPTNGSTGNLLSFTWSIPINDLENDTFSWTIQCNNGQTNYGTEASNGTKSLSLSALSYSTTYNVWVNATDPTASGLYTKKWYIFTTKSSGGGGGGGGGQPPVEPQNKKPIANVSAGEPYQGLINSTIFFNGTRSYDPDGTITKWFWVFGDNTNGTGKTISHSYSKAGTYIVTLTVTDNKGAINTVTTTCVITQQNRSPTTPMVTGSTLLGTKNIIYTYTARSTDPDNDRIQYTFNWGDPLAPSQSSGFMPSGSDFTINHSWATAGRYNVTVTTTDNHSNSSYSFLMYINAVPTGDIGYLLDNNGDGTYDTFYSDVSKQITTVQKKDGNYNIDSNGDGTWDYTLDAIKGLIPYQEPKTSGFELIIVIAIGIVISFCIIIIFYFFKKQKKSKTRLDPPSELPITGDKSVVLVKNLSRIKGKKWILTDINLDLKQGKLYAITGPSGSGKSRLMESIVGREKPTTGDVEISGVDIYKDKMKATRLFGFVPQRPELNMYQTPVENMMNSAIQWSVENPEEKINELLNKVGLHNRKNVKAGDLSGGQQKRLSIAMELLKEPSVLFLDEPTTGLDPEIQGNIFSIIQELNKEGASIVITTHNVEEAEIADEIIIVNNGKIAAQGSPKHLASHTPGRGTIIQVDLSEVSENMIQCIKELEFIKFMWRTGRHIRIFCNNQDVIEISNSIRKCGGKIEGIKTEKTSMQDIFRFYTGKSPDE